MANNPFEDSRIAAGTLNRGGQKPGSPGETPVRESNAISRDDVRDGCAGRRVIAASALIGDRVHNAAGEDLGGIEEIVVDIQSGRVAYAVLSFGGFLGIGDKLFAVPWGALEPDVEEHRFILEIDRDKLKHMTGFDKDDWPDMGDPTFANTVHSDFGVKPYWERDFTDAGDYVGDNVQPSRSMEYEPPAGYRAGGKKQQFR